MEINLVNPLTTDRRPQLEILDISLGPNCADYLVRVDGTTLKQVTLGLEPFIRPEKDALARKLDRFWPSGDWDEGYFRAFRAGSTDVEYRFQRLTWSGAASFREVDGYNRRVVDCDALAHVDNLGNHVHVVTCAEFPQRPLIYKFAAARRDRPRIHHEAAMYGWLSQHADQFKGRAPTFVAHVYRGGQIIGFLCERVPGSMPYFARATSSQYKAFRKALEHLHALGIKYGSVSGYRFRISEDLIDDDGLPFVYLVNFGDSERGVPKPELEEELALLRDEMPDMLKDESSESD